MHVQKRKLLSIHLILAMFYSANVTYDVFFLVYKTDFFQHVICQQI